MNWFNKYYGGDKAAKIVLFIVIPIIVLLFVLGGLNWKWGIGIYLAFVGLFYIMRKNP